MSFYSFADELSKIAALKPGATLRTHQEDAHQFTEEGGGRGLQ